MGKRNQENEVVEATEEVAVDAPKKGGRKIMLTLEDGSTVARTEYIRARWATKEVSRGEIAKEVSTLQGVTVAYQIVFAATKGHEGGPDKVAKPEATEADAA